MKIIIDSNAGFCFGVKRAIQLAIDASKNGSKPYSLGPLIHNPQVVDYLKNKGIETIDGFSNLKGGRIIIRSHGVHPSIYSEIKEKKLDIVDATCPFVKKVQKYAVKLKEEGYSIVIVGDKNHPEVKGILGFINGEGAVIKSEEEIDEIKINSKVGVVAQTTQSPENFKKIISKLLNKAKEMKIFNTICDSTVRRQKSALSIARKSDLMIVVGGKNSANTHRLVVLCQQAGTETKHIETPDELRKDWFEGKDTIGITTGASTPEWIVNDLIKKILDDYGYRVSIVRN